MNQLTQARQTTIKEELTCSGIASFGEVIVGAVRVPGTGTLRRVSPRHRPSPLNPRARRTETPKKGQQGRGKEAPLHRILPVGAARSWDRIEASQQTNKNTEAAATRSTNPKAREGSKPGNGLESTKVEKGDAFLGSGDTEMSSSLLLYVESR